MKLFHILTIVVSISVFFALFIYIAVIFYTNEKVFPTDITNCPDYWKIDPSGKCIIPKKNELNLGNLKDKGMPIYSYKHYGNDNTGNMTTKKDYSYLTSYYNPVHPKVVVGTQESNLPLGYYQIDIPYGYDSDNPQYGVIDFNDSGWGSYGNPFCEIKKWASQHNIQWDGIANYKCK
jgi:hypothetical protein